MNSVLPPEKSKNTVGRPTVPYRKVMGGIIYVLRTGCQWKMLPREYGSGSTCHRRFQEWVRLGIFKKLWVDALKTYDNTKRIMWTWQSLDSISIKSPVGGEMSGSNPPDRSKLGTNSHILTDKNGIPLSAFITPANRHDIKAVTDVVDNKVVKRLPLSHSKGRKQQLQHLCLDRAYSSKTVEQQIVMGDYVPHVPSKRRKGQNDGAPFKKGPYIRNRRWVVERTNSWHNRFRKLFTRYEKKAENYLGLLELSCSIIIYRKAILG
jgi:transposase